MNKKAGVFDILPWIATVFIFAVGLIGTFYSINVAKDSIMDNLDTFSHGNVNASEIAEFTIEKLEAGLEPLKWISYMIIIGSIIVLIIGNYLVRTNPLWVVPYIFVMMFAVIIAAPVSNAYEGLMTDPVLGSTFREFEVVGHIFLNLPMWVLLIGVLGGIVMFVNIVRDRSAPGEAF